MSNKTKNILRFTQRDTSNKNKGVTGKVKADKSLWKTIGKRIIGVALIIMSFSLYIQVLPLIFVFIGAYMGIPTDAKIGHIDTMIWICTNVSVLVIATYVYIQGLRYVWFRLVWFTHKK